MEHVNVSKVGLGRVVTKVLVIFSLNPNNRCQIDKADACNSLLEFFSKFYFTVFCIRHTIIPNIKARLTLLCVCVFCFVFVLLRLFLFSELLSQFNFILNFNIAQLGFSMLPSGIFTKKPYLFNPNVVIVIFFSSGSCLNCSTIHGECVKGFCVCDLGWEGRSCELEGYAVHGHLLNKIEYIHFVRRFPYIDTRELF